jgi:hypothetical protein
MPRKPSSPKAPEISPEMIRRYSKPLARTAMRICREVQIEVSKIVHGAELPADRLGIVLPKPDDDEKVEQVLALTTPAVRLAEALDRGDLDDPFIGWELVMACARELGPRYIDMVGVRPTPEVEQNTQQTSNVHTLLSKLTINGSLVGELMAAETPAFALGVVEERKSLCGMFALHLDSALPEEVSKQGFRFGHALIGNDNYIVVQFIFEFYGFARYEVLVNPSSPVVRHVLQRMVESGEYMFFAISREGRATVFKSEGSGSDLSGLQVNWPKILKADTSETQYAEAVAAFERRHDGEVMTWICRNEMEHLDLTDDRLELTP